MNLRNQQITVAELLGNKEANAVFQRRFGRYMNHPMVAAANSLTLRQLVDLAAVWLPQKVIRETLEELERL